MTINGKATTMGSPGFYLAGGIGACIAALSSLMGLLAHAGPIIYLISFILALGGMILIAFGFIAILKHHATRLSFYAAVDFFLYALSQLLFIVTFLARSKPLGQVSLALTLLAVIIAYGLASVVLWQLRSKGKNRGMLLSLAILGISSLLFRALMYGLMLADTKVGGNLKVFLLLGGGLIATAFHVLLAVYFLGIFSHAGHSVHGQQG